MPILLDEPGLHRSLTTPQRVHRRDPTVRLRRRRACLDDRPYAPHQFTIPAAILADNTDYEPEWKVDRRYWVAGATASVGVHKNGTHPSDGAVGGSALTCNFRVVEGATEVALFNSVLTIPVGEHGDEFDAETNPFQRSDVNVERLHPGQSVFARVINWGSSGTLVMTLVLVPVRSPVEDPDDPL